MEQEHKRRVRYKGTHPRTFQEKYKELDPERYQSDVEAIIQSGKTPAGMHIPIMVGEILDFLQIQPGQIGCDATLGYGGHTRKMLERLQGQGHLYATDVDPIESEKTRARLEALGYGPELLTIRRMNFADLDQVAPGVKFDFVLADLGVSSMQIDDPGRGFTFKHDGPLDLRLDPTSGVTAAERLRELNEGELAAMLNENSDEPYALPIARAVTRRFKRGESITTTRELAHLLRDSRFTSLTVITTALQISQELAPCEYIQVIQIGGIIRRSLFTSMGPMATEALRNLHADKAFIGVNGVDPQVGLTTQNMLECEIKRHMIEASTQSFVLADASKMGCIALGVIAPLNRVDYVVTDQGVPTLTARKIEEAGVDVVIAEA